ncbi:MAG TPA: MarR family transcriptional regulator [Candidatus Binataceae bacterium]|nr:MarR family transcriptional regulator [Candidatus Binataceae bacterium]
MPALLRAARTAYGSAMRAALAEAGFDDIPKNGLYVIGALRRSGTPLSRIIQELGVSKQSAGQLVDALVLRGYLEREIDEEDRRRLTVSLSERGRAVADIARKAGERVDALLAKKVGREHVVQTRKTLMALIAQSRGAR